MHENFMLQCFQLASKGLGNVAPNPLVGAVVVHENKLIGKGFHEFFGGPHAEVNAIHSVENKLLLPSSALYVNLEPCNHTGKTPPCCDLILQHKIPLVIIANEDPHPQVNGTGIERLRKSGVKVVSGVLREKGEFLNRRFFTYHLKKRPYVILKWAQTKDGFMDKIRQEGEKGMIAITNENSLRKSHKWRTEEQAILVGKNTVINDNPQLTARLWHGKDPLRVVLDPDLETDFNSRIYTAQGESLVFNRKKNEPGNPVSFYRPGEFTLKNILHHLYEKQIQSVIIEGGSKTLQHFIDENVWDEARVFTADTEWKTGLKAPVMPVPASQTSNETGDELKIYYHA